MGAVFSSCGLYRYQLSRDWANGPRLAFIMLNPSTADSDVDDPTIRRCVGFARDGGYGGILIGNLFAWRATDAIEIKKSSQPIGSANDAALAKIIMNAPTIVCAWGNGGTYMDRNDQVLRMIRNLGRRPHCLRMTKQGHPSHPLYLPRGLRPMEMGLWAP
jgi:hypothetical protein